MEKEEYSLETESSVGEKLVNLRKRIGLTQQRAADGIGITRSSLNSYENDIRRPKIHIIKKIADYYGVTVDYLLGDEEYEEPELSPQTNILLQTLKGASEEDIAQVIRIVEALRK